MRTRKPSVAWMAIAAALLALCTGRFAPSQNLNRIASTAVDPATGAGRLVLLDVDTRQPEFFPLPSGFRPGSLVAMDRYGDVWLNDLDSYDIRKFSGANGAVLALVSPGRRSSFMAPDSSGNLIVATWDTAASPPAGVYLQKYSPSGALLQFLDIRTLFPPGLYLPRQSGSVPSTFLGGIPRFLVTRSGAIWLGVLQAAYHPVLRLNPDWTLHSSYGLYLPYSLVPAEDESVWVLFYHVPQTGIVPGTMMPGLPVNGWAHLSASGALLGLTPDGTAIGAGAPSQGHMGADGRQYQHPGAPSPVTAGVLVRDPSYPPWPGWFNVYFYTGSAYTSGFHLDGNGDLWLTRNTTPFNPAQARNYLQHASTVPPYPVHPGSGAPPVSTFGTNAIVWTGDAFRTSTAWQSFFWTSFLGNPTLHEYAMYTDPDGDLDGDGVSNLVELKNGTNPFVPSAASVHMSVAGGAPGTAMVVSYTIPRDAGLPYLAPFASAVSPATVAPGISIPFSPADPLVALTALGPPAGWFAGTSGLLDAQGRTQATLDIPPVPALSGLQIYSGILTADPSRPPPLKTVSPAYPIVIP